MKRIRTILLLFHIAFFVMPFNAQSKLVLNGGIITIANGATLVVNDSLNNAITRNSGHIISEGENNLVVWNIGLTTGTYTVPFGYGASDFIPLSFTKTAGTGSGYFSFSTYRTATWQNSNYLPVGITHLNTPGGTDNSAFVIDRFWQIAASGYTAKPDLSTVTFTYIDVEHMGGSNTILESNLKAQRWNDASSVWGDFGPVGVNDAVANTVIVNSVPGVDLYKWWTLVDQSSPLPIELLSSTANCENDKVVIEWSTASEINNDYFSIERSRNAMDWEVIEIVTGAGNSLQEQRYSITDEEYLNEIGYYRIKQTDFNGKEGYLSEFAVECKQQNEFSISVYPNPSSGVFTLEASFDKNEPYFLQIIDVYGKKAKEFFVESNRQKIDLSSQPKGIYLIKVFTNDLSREYVKKLIVE